MTEEEFNALAEPVIDDQEETESTETTEPEATEQQETGEETTAEPSETTPEETTPAQQATQQEQPKRQLTDAQIAQQAALEREYQNALNKVNPFNGKVVQNPTDFFEYKRQLQEHAKKVESQNIFDGIKNGTATQSDFDRYIQQLVQNNPNIQAARQMAARLERREQEERKQRNRERLQSDINEFNKEYPSCEIKKINDIDSNPEIVRYLSRGLSFADAYYLTHRNEMIEAQKAGVRQAVVNQANGKKHLQTTSSTSSEDVTVSQDEIDNFKHYLDWDDKKIVEYLKKEKRRNKNV